MCILHSKRRALLTNNISTTMYMYFIAVRVINFEREFVGLIKCSKNMELCTL